MTTFTMSTIGTSLAKDGLNGLRFGRRTRKAWNVAVTGVGTGVWVYGKARDLVRPTIQEGAIAATRWGVSREYVTPESAPGVAALLTAVGTSVVAGAAVSAALCVTVAALSKVAAVAASKASATAIL